MEREAYSIVMWDIKCKNCIIAEHYSNLENIHTWKVCHVYKDKKIYTMKDRFAGGEQEE